MILTHGNVTGTGFCVSSGPGSTAYLQRIDSAKEEETSFESRVRAKT